MHECILWHLSECVIACNFRIDIVLIADDKGLST